MAAWKNVVPAARQQFDSKREVLLREAASSFNRRGYHGTSLTEIAKKLGVTKAALYTYIPSKEELLYYCHDSAMDAGFVSLEKAKKIGTTGLEKLTMSLRGYLEMILGEESSYVVLLEEHAMKPAHVKVITKRRDMFERQMRDFVREGITDGSVVPCNPKLAVFAALGALNWVQKWFVPGGEWSGKQLALALSQILERAIASDPSKSLIEDPASLLIGDDLDRRQSLQRAPGPSRNKSPTRPVADLPPRSTPVLRIKREQP